MISISSDVSERDKCKSCSSKDRVVNVEVGNEKYITFFHLCSECSKDLYIKLEEMSQKLR